jgi:predicted GIY-YIG superfamily endonuclease
MESLEDFPENCIGFVYLIKNNVNNKIYIGRKSLYSNTNKKLTKKEISEQTGPGRKPTKKLVTKESNWKVYMGSSKELLADVKEHGEDKFIREILHLCYSKKQLTFYEINYQMKYNVLEVDSYNDNILGKFYRKDLI